LWNERAYITNLALITSIFGVVEDEKVIHTFVFPACHVGKVVIGGASAFLLVANCVHAKHLCALDGLLARRFVTLGHLEAEI
jgi:hypothetical protein